MAGWSAWFLYLADFIVTSKDNRLATRVLGNDGLLLLLDDEMRDQKTKIKCETAGIYAFCITRVIYELGITAYCAVLWVPF